MPSLFVLLSVLPALNCIVSPSPYRYVTLDAFFLRSRWVAYSYPGSDRYECQPMQFPRLQAMSLP
jgi:hypothetical protein